jgi:hypothetical protein
VALNEKQKTEKELNIRISGHGITERGIFEHAKQSIETSRVKNVRRELLGTLQVATCGTSTSKSK